MAMRGTISSGIQFVNDSTTQILQNGGNSVFINGSTSAITVTLPPVANLIPGAMFSIYNFSASTITL
jgi:hypothetical protein